jgi:hypothetical protein
MTDVENLYPAVPAVTRGRGLPMPMGGELISISQVGPL